MNDATGNHAQEDLALRRAMELVSEPVFVVDERAGRIADVNPAACQVLAIPRDALLGRAWADTVGRLGEVRTSRVGDRWLVAVAHAPAGEGRAAHASLRDPLTGLANRDALLARISSDNEDKRRRRLALLFIDLDGFKQVNDTFGHVAGDSVLRVVAERLSDHVRPGDLVVRYGGDEFLVVVEAVARRRDLERLARRILRAVQRPLPVEGCQVVLSASIGIAQRKSRTPSIDALIAEADRAMYQSKSRTRGATPPTSANPGFTLTYAI